MLYQYTYIVYLHFFVISLWYILCDPSHHYYVGEFRKIWNSIIIMSFPFQQEIWSVLSMLFSIGKKLPLGTMALLD